MLWQVVDTSLNSGLFLNTDSPHGIALDLAADNAAGQPVRRVAVEMVRFLGQRPTHLPSEPEPPPTPSDPPPLS